MVTVNSGIPACLAVRSAGALDWNGGLEHGYMWKETHENFFARLMHSRTQHVFTILKLDKT